VPACPPPALSALALLVKTPPLPLLSMLVMLVIGLRLQGPTVAWPFRQPLARGKSRAPHPPHALAFGADSADSADLALWARLS